MDNTVHIYYVYYVRTWTILSMVYYCTQTILVNITNLQKSSGNSHTCASGQYQAIFLLPRGLSTRLSPSSPSHIPPTIYMPLTTLTLPTYRSPPSPLPCITHPLTPPRTTHHPHPFHVSLTTPHPFHVSLTHSPPSPLPYITHPLAPPRTTHHPHPSHVSLTPSPTHHPHPPMYHSPSTYTTHHPHPSHVSLTPSPLHVPLTTFTPSMYHSPLHVPLTTLTPSMYHSPLHVPLTTLTPSTYDSLPSPFSHALSHTCLTHKLYNSSFSYIGCSNYMLSSPRVEGSEREN